MDGNEEWRLRLFRLVTWHFVTDSLRQTVNNLWHDGSFWRARTWVDGWRFLFGERGIVRALAGPWRRYRRADFHPSQQDESRAVARRGAAMNGNHDDTARKPGPTPRSRLAAGMQAAQAFAGRGNSPADQHRLDLRQPIRCRANSARPTPSSRS